MSNIISSTCIYYLQSNNNLSRGHYLPSIQGLVQRKLLEQDYSLRDSQNKIAEIGYKDIDATQKKLKRYFVSRGMSLCKSKQKEHFRSLLQGSALYPYREIKGYKWSLTSDRFLTKTNKKEEALNLR